MAVFTKNFIQDLKGCLDVRVTEGLVFSADNESNVVSVELYNGGEAATLTGSVVVYVIRADGNTVVFNGTLSGNVASAVLPQSCFVIPGPIAVMLQIVSGDVRTTVLKAIFTAVASSTGAIIDPGHVIPDITDIIAMLDQMEQATTAANAAAAAVPALVAPTFSASTAYAVGAYVYKDGHLYRFTSPHPAGAWNSGHVTQVYLSGDVTLLKSTVDGAISDITSLETTVAGKQDALTFDNTPTANSNNPVKSGGVYTAIATESARAQNEEGQKVNKPTTSPNGTSGQLLRTNGDGTTTWVDVGLPTDQQVAEAVDDWLDAHPEATTTVQDGAVTWAKLNSTVQGVIDFKAPGIVINTDDDTCHEGLTNVKQITFKGNSLAFTNARYTTEKNVLPKFNVTETFKDVSIAANGWFVTYNGNASNYGQYLLLNKIAIPTQQAGNYIFVIDMSDSDPSHTRTELAIWYDEGSPAYERVVYTYIGNSTVIQFTAARAFSKVSLHINVSKKNYVDFRQWFGLFKSCTITDTGTPVPQDGTLQYSSASIAPLPLIDTMQHESSIEYIADTKEYIDEHTPDIIGYWNDNVYAMPEKFGAVGDGVTDDSTAIANCLAYAATTGKAVRGYGKYKTSATITLGTRYADIYLREITYTGNQAAVSIENMDIIMGFHRIESAGIGISFGGTSPYARQCQVKGNEVISTSHCIAVNDLTLYCTVEIRMLSSTNGDCIHRNYVSTFGGNEFVYSNSSCNCPNGYVAYDIESAKFYNFTIEGNCQYGLRNPFACVCVGCRTAEQIGGMSLRIMDGDASRNNGPLITFTKTQSGIYNFRMITPEVIPWFAIDMTALANYDEIDTWDEWSEISAWPNDVGMAINGYGVNARRFNSKQLYIIGGHKVAVPLYRNSISMADATINLAFLDTASSDAEIESANGLLQYMATDFVTGTSHTDLYLNASYGAVGYNDITLTQKDGQTCTIYDKLGNVLFDGTNAGNGKWIMKCAADKTSNGRYTGATNWWVYDGTNETWEITNIS